MSRARGMKVGGLVAMGLVAALALAFFVGPEASSQPDGLNRVAIDKGLADQEQAHALDGSPVAGYSVKGVDDGRLATGLAGVIGVIVTFAVGFGLFALLRWSRRRTPSAVPEP
jgi:hypothetical protein